MRKFLLIVALAISAFAVAFQAPQAQANTSVQITSMVFSWTGAVCQAPNCTMYVERVRTGSIWTAGMGTAGYCTTNFPYFHFQYGKSNCLTRPFRRNTYKYVTSDAYDTNEYFNVWTQELCSGGGFHMSVTRTVLVDFQDVLHTYAGAYQGGGACLQAAPVS